MKSYDYKFDFRDKRNLSLVMDFYELTMSQCYFNRDKEEEVVFDMFYRRNPDGGGYSICAGLEEVIGYIQNLHFEEDRLSALAEQILGGIPRLPASLLFYRRSVCGP